MQCGQAVLHGFGLLFCGSPWEFRENVITQLSATPMKFLAEQEQADLRIDQNIVNVHEPHVGLHYVGVKVY